MTNVGGERALELYSRIREFQSECAMTEYLDTGEAEELLRDSANFLVDFVAAERKEINEAEEEEKND